MIKENLKLDIKFIPITLEPWAFYMHYLILILWSILFPEMLQLQCYKGEEGSSTTNEVTFQLCVFKIALKIF